MTHNFTDAVVALFAEETQADAETARG